MKILPLKTILILSLFLTGTEQLVAQNEWRIDPVIIKFSKSVDTLSSHDTGLLLKLFENMMAYPDFRLVLIAPMDAKTKNLQKRRRKRILELLEKNEISASRFIERFTLGIATNFFVIRNL